MGNTKSKILLDLAIALKFLLASNGLASLSHFIGSKIKIKSKNNSVPYA
jgi:hypothetical protein